MASLEIGFLWNNEVCTVEELDDFQLVSASFSYFWLLLAYWIQLNFSAEISYFQAIFQGKFQSLNFS